VFRSHRRVLESASRAYCARIQQRGCDASATRCACRLEHVAPTTSQSARVLLQRRKHHRNRQHRNQPPVRSTVQDSADCLLWWPFRQHRQAFATATRFASDTTSAAPTTGRHASQQQRPLSSHRLHPSPRLQPHRRCQPPPQVRQLPRRPHLSQQQPCRPRQCRPLVRH
jgi:hypothetical protein